MAENDKTNNSHDKNQNGDKNQAFKNDWLDKSEDVQTSFYNQLMEDFGHGQTNETQFKDAEALF